MVAFNDLDDTQLDRIFHAMADRTRRDILARTLGTEPLSMSVLADRYEMSFTAVQKHIKVLEEAGLVTKKPRGRERLIRGNPEQIALARDLLDQLESLWEARFGQLDAVLSEPED